MIGIVIVSHSARLADGVVELAREMAGPEVGIAAAGGLDLPDRPLGTDPVLIMAAIDRVFSPDGVLVLMDLGSAILSAEMALDLLPDAQRSLVTLCEAPLVEGAVAAAVQARLGASVVQAASEARAALAPKIAQLGGAHPSADQPAADQIVADGGQTIRVVVRNKHGLHARPAARLVQLAGRFKSAVRLQNLTNGRGPVSAKSINGVATLDARHDHSIEVSAAGPDAAEALTAIQDLAANNFGDDDSLPGFDHNSSKPQTSMSAPVKSGTLTALGASPGIVISVARLLRVPMPVIPDGLNTDPEATWSQVRAALDQTKAQIEATLAAVARLEDPGTAEIFEAHILFLSDEALLEPARHAIFDQYLNAAAAWQTATEDLVARYEALEDDYLRARAVDVRAVGRQVIWNILGEAAPSPTLDDPGILIATDLTPADTARLDTTRVLGIATAQGSTTSHSAILARAAGIPAVVGLGDSILQVVDGTPLILDGDQGVVLIYPDPATQLQFEEKAADQHQSQAQARAVSNQPAVTRDGRAVLIAANIGSATEVQKAVEAGAEGVGLFRTEFLFLDRQTAPDEEEQYIAYRAAAVALVGRPLVIRTLDVGGDKPLPYIRLGAEANPFLGVRAIRLCLAQPELFKIQLRAILRAAAELPDVQIMFPMIATLGELHAAKALLADAAAELRARAVPTPDRIGTGIMVEIPSVAVQAARFAAEVDFFSIGTNDLTQYTMAAERGNPLLAGLTDAFQPAVLQLIAQVIDAAHARGKWVSVCGELAGDPLAVPILTGLGIDELSMNVKAIPGAKQIVRGLTLATIREPMHKLLDLETPEAIRDASKQS